MVNSKKIIIISASVLVVVIAIITWPRLFGRGTDDLPVDPPKYVDLYGQSAGSSGQAAAKPKDTILFQHENPKFSFEYFNELTATSTQVEGVEAIIFSREGEQAGFQLLVTPLPDVGLLTKGEIMAAYPELQPTEMQEAIIGDGLRAFIFFGQDPVIGRTREVWFSYGKYLYQITGYAAYDGKLAYIMSTFKIIY